MYNGRLKGKFVSKNVINLSKWNLTENEISFLPKDLNFMPTCNKLDVAMLKFELEVEQFDRWQFTKAVAERCSAKKVFLGISQNSQENICARVSFLIKLQVSASVCNFIKKETDICVFLWILRTFKNNFSYRIPPVAASDYKNDKRDILTHPFITKSTFNPRNKDAGIELYLSSLEEKLLKMEVPKDKFNKFTIGSGMPYCIILKMIKLLW